LTGKTPPFVRLQDLPAKAARFCLELARFCREELNLVLDGRSLVVAYSGGADSRALLFALHFLSRRLRLRLHAAILNHGFRREAGREVAEARALCAGLGIGFYTEAQDVPAFARAEGLGLEEAGRTVRQGFLERARRETQSDWIALGHQLNDLAEDSLMRLMRGAGWPALAGMAGVREERRTLRPLLLTPRSAVEAFLTEIGETWHNDRMNDDEAYFRNRVRRNLLPLCVRENPSFLNGVAERWRMARADERFLKEQLGALAAERREEGIFLPRAVLAGASPALRLRKYMAILASLGAGQVAAVHLRALDAAWRRNEGGKLAQFPGGKGARIRDGGIVFFRRD
jgi:tRNA(Ile)-lysidine synthase